MLLDAVAAPFHQLQHRRLRHQLTPPPLHSFHRTYLTLCFYPLNRAWLVFCRYCGRMSRKDNLSRHCQKQHCKYAAYLKVDGVPSHEPWHENWQQMVLHPNPVWVTVGDDESSISSSRIINQPASEDDGGGSEDLESD